MWIKCSNGDLVNLDLIESIYIKEESERLYDSENNVYYTETIGFYVVAKGQPGGFWEAQESDICGTYYLFSSPEKEAAKNYLQKVIENLDHLVI